MAEQLGLFAEGEPQEPRLAAPGFPMPYDVRPAPDRGRIDLSTVLANGESACNSCYRCDLGTNRTRAVYGGGNHQALIMLIGEGPGAQEDATGKPFVGASGQLLTKILASVGLDRERDVYLTNVVKCRAPGNRTPTTAEIVACRPYLDEQIALIDPKIVLLAGAAALKGVLNLSGITKLRGEWIERGGRSYMPIFHPAYLLRQIGREIGGPKWLTWQDMQKVRRRYDEVSAGPRRAG